MTQEKLNEMLELHQMWLDQEKDGIRANFSGMDLSRVCLKSANLAGAYLWGAYLSRANLSRASMFGANLSRANLSGANLKYADLYDATLYEANLSKANLSKANLYKAYLSEANLTDTNLTGATINWTSHWLVSELLFRAADSDSRRNAAQIVRKNTNLCWSDFLAMDNPEKKWALSVLLKYITPHEYYYSALIERALQRIAQ